MCSQCDPKAMLRASGLKATPQRIRVLAEVQASREALAPQVLLARLREDEPMDKVTLYRALDSLAGHGLITRHEAGDGSGRYCAGGPAHPDHHHFYCLGCRRLLCLGPGRGARGRGPAWSETGQRAPGRHVPALRWLSR